LLLHCDIKSPAKTNNKKEKTATNKMRAFILEPPLLMIISYLFVPLSIHSLLWYMQSECHQPFKMIQSNFFLIANIWVEKIIF
jgi:hypothetical protein